MNQSIKIMKALFESFFIHKKPEEALLLLNDGIYACGFANDAVVTGIEQAHKLLQDVIHRGHDKYLLSFYDEREIGEHGAELGFSLSWGDITVKYRVFGLTENLDGTEKLSALHFSMVNPRHAVTMVEDIQLAKALEAAESATQAKTEFLSRMSHEIRTPLNAIMGMTAIAQDNKSDFLQVSDCLSKIESSSRYLLTLINDILEMSRIESGNAKLTKEKFDFVELISEIRTVVEPLAKKSEIRLEISNSTGNGSYYGDHIRIQQIMINLIGNAVKFTKKSGRVRFEVSETKNTDSMTTFEFLIEDTGIGMSEEFMQKMFEPFTQEDSTTTSKYGGSGLGLAISKSLIEAMGGTIAVESMVGIGSNFTVDIPLERVQDSILLHTDHAKTMPEADIETILSNRRILMAEDHPMNVMVAKRLLERKGMTITVAENGRIAVDTFRNSAPHEYDAILMDIRMPVMDGLEAARQIRALERPDAKEVPIIAMTANALEEDRNNSKAAGMNDHLAKPIEPKTMYQTLAEQIARRTV